MHTESLARLQCSTGEFQYFNTVFLEILNVPLRMVFANPVAFYGTLHGMYSFLASYISRDKDNKCYLLLQNIALYIFFGIFLLAGGIASMFYSDDHLVLWKIVCQDHDTDLNKFCRDLEIIRSTEMASAVSTTSRIT